MGATMISWWYSRGNSCIVAENVCLNINIAMLGDLEAYLLVVISFTWRLSWKSNMVAILYSDNVGTGPLLNHNSGEICRKKGDLFKFRILLKHPGPFWYSNSTNSPTMPQPEIQREGISMEWWIAWYTKSPHTFIMQDFEIVILFHANCTWDLNQIDCLDRTCMPNALIHRFGYIKLNILVDTQIYLWQTPAQTDFMVTVRQVYAIINILKYNIIWFPDIGINCRHLSMQKLKSHAPCHVLVNKVHGEQTQTYPWVTQMLQQLKQVYLRLNLGLSAWGLSRN